MIECKEKERESGLLPFTSYSYSHVDITKVSSESNITRLELVLQGHMKFLALSLS